MNVLAFSPANLRELLRHLALEYFQVVHYRSVIFVICLLLLALIHDWLLFHVLFTGVLNELLLVNRDVVLGGLALLADLFLKLCLVQQPHGLRALKVIVVDQVLRFDHV